jgi:hypothetical protein
MMPQIETGLAQSRKISIRHSCVAKKIDPNDSDKYEAKSAKALAEAELARRRATMALAYVREVLKYTPTHPRIDTMMRNIEKEFLEG